MVYGYGYGYGYSGHSSPNSYWYGQSYGLLGSSYLRGNRGYGSQGYWGAPNGRNWSSYNGGDIRSSLRRVSYENAVDRYLYR